MEYVKEEKLTANIKWREKITGFPVNIRFRWFHLLQKLLLSLRAEIILWNYEGLKQRGACFNLNFF